MRKCALGRGGAHGPRGTLGGRAGVGGAAGGSVGRGGSGGIAAGGWCAVPTWVGSDGPCGGGLAAALSGSVVSWACWRGPVPEAASGGVGGQGRHKKSSNFLKRKHLL